MESVVWYQDWKAWSAIVAWLSFAIGLAPFIWKKLKKANPVLTPHTTISVCHRIGVTNMNWFLRVENNGGADLDVTGIDFVVSDGHHSLALPVASFFRTASDLSVFAGFVLKSGESWQGMLSSYEVLPSDDQREMRYILNATRAEIRMQDQGVVTVSEQLLERIHRFYNAHFRFKSRAYEVFIKLKCRNHEFYSSEKYRFTLFESDVSELESHAERFVHGDGITWFSAIDAWLRIPVTKG